MTRKDYELIAKSFSLINKTYKKELNNPSNTAEERASFLGAVRGIELVANSLASSLSIENSRFNGARFLEACGVEKDPTFLVFSPSNSVNA
jgi:hypothetical protein